MKINKRGYWENNSLIGHIYDETLCVELYNYLKNHSVIDLGCGGGQYTKYFKERNMTCNCFDGNPHTPNITNNLCGVLDLTEEIDVGIYDYVLCLEVGEHIPEEYENTLIKNIHKSNKLGVVLSWGIVGQQGSGHINCRNNDYIRNIFENMGYVSNVDVEKKLRLSATYSWFHNTIMVFEKKSQNFLVT